MWQLKWLSYNFFITIKICYLISNNPKEIIHNPLLNKHDTKYKNLI
jgi:hypothetical protein